MTKRKKPTRAEQKARTKERHEIVRSIMQEPDDIVHFPVAFGRIAMSAAVWGAVALGILALGVLSSAVFLMRDEISGLGQQIQKKDVDLGILSGELQKVRDQMFGEQEEMAQQGIALRLIDAETGVVGAVRGVTLKDTPYPLGPASRAVNGKFLYWTDEEGILRVNLTDGTAYRLVTKPFISSIAVSKDGSWLAYAYNQGLSDPESVGTTRAVAMPLTGRGDPIELGELSAVTPGNVPTIHGFSDDGKELLWTVFVSDEGISGERRLYRTRIANGQVSDPFVVKDKPGSIVLGYVPDGSSAALLEGNLNNDNTVAAQRLVLVDANGRRTVRYTMPMGTTVRFGASWSVDGSAIVLSTSQGFLAFTLKGASGPTTISPSFDAVTEDNVEVAYEPGKFVLTLIPSLAGQYSYRNLATEAISRGDGPFVSIIGMSAATNNVVLLVDERE